MGVALVEKCLWGKAGLKCLWEGNPRQMAAGSLRSWLARQVLYWIARQFSCLWQGWHPTGKGREKSFPSSSAEPWTRSSLPLSQSYPASGQDPSGTLCFQAPCTDGSQQGEQSLLILFSILNVPRPCITLAIPWLLISIPPSPGYIGAWDVFKQ